MYKPDRERREPGGEQPDSSGTRRLTEGGDTHDRERERDQRGGYRDDEHGHRVERPAQRHVEVLGVARLPREVGEDRRVDRLREHRVGREEEHPGDLVRERPALDGVADDDRGEEQHADHRVLEHRPPREAQHAPDGFVVAPEPRHEPKARCASTAIVGIATNAATPSVPPRARISRSPVVRSSPGAGPATTRKMAIALTTTTVRPIGRHRGDGEAPLGVEDGDRHGTYRVHHDLRARRSAAGRSRGRAAGAAIVLVRDAGGQDACDQRGRDDPDDRDRSEHQEGDPEQRGPRAARPRPGRRGRDGSTNVGTSTAESAPAASSSNSTFETEFDDWYVLPR